jgi:hypothetical protein
MLTPFPSLVLSAVLLAAAAQPAVSQPAVSQPAPRKIAPRPPMGWNSWDAYGLTITEDQFRDNVDVLAKTLKPFGWTYAVIDEGWFLRNPEDRPKPERLVYEIDANGRYNPVPARFPSALNAGQNTGFAALGAYVHAQGLKFGIHIVRGIPRVSVTQNLPVAASTFHAQDAADTSDVCPWDPTNWGVRDNAAGQAWYDSLLRQYAAWGVDYLKVDCISDHPYKPSEIRMIHRAIVKTGRPILLSLSPGPTSPGIAPKIAPLAQMWRISDDIWDYWRNPQPFPQSLHDQFPLAAGWAPLAHDGRWPDADMLPFGYLGPSPGDGSPRLTRLTHDEQQTMFTLWSMMRSPLILGANLTRLDDWTVHLLTNPDVIKIQQTGHNQRQVSREGNVVVWTSAGPGDTRYLALFNLGDSDKTVQQKYTFYNLPRESYSARELWTQTDLPRSSQVQVTLRPHACALFALNP